MGGKGEMWEEEEMRGGRDVGRGQVRKRKEGRRELWEEEMRGGERCG